MSALFLKDLAQKTRRGQIGRVKARRIPGGKSYGYDVAHMGEERGCRAINPREAAVVRRIYTEYAAGKGSLAIVRDLNRDGEPGPSGGPWNASAIVGSAKRCNGVLNNELYRGVIVYNRQRFVKDPSTGKRVSRANPESDGCGRKCPSCASLRMRFGMTCSGCVKRAAGQNFIRSAVRAGCFQEWSTAAAAEHGTTSQRVIFGHDRAFTRALANSSRQPSTASAIISGVSN
jgi:hypothetical protein